MIEGWETPALGPCRCVVPRQDGRALLDFAIPQQAVAVEQIELPVESLFDLQRLRALGRPPAVDEIQLRRMADGVSVPQGVHLPNRQDPA